VLKEALEIRIASVLGALIALHRLVRFAFSLLPQQFPGLVLSLLDGRRVELGPLLGVAVLAGDIDADACAIRKPNPGAIVGGTIGAAVPVDGTGACRRHG
jgi:hypothetical protein